VTRSTKGLVVLVAIQLVLSLVYAWVLLRWFRL
jgi:hypothetical protein